MIRRTPLRPGAPPKRKSWLKRSTKRIPQVNVEATKRRRARNAKRMRSPEYLSAKAGAMERAGGRCEYTLFYGARASELGPTIWAVEKRCEETERLQFHELRYPQTRPITKDDGLIYCYSHHMLTESRKLHKRGRPFRA